MKAKLLKGLIDVIAGGIVTVWIAVGGLLVCWLFQWIYWLLAGPWAPPFLSAKPKGFDAAPVAVVATIVFGFLVAVALLESPRQKR